MTLRAGVIGWPIDHSKSPILHGEWLQRHQIDGSYEKVAAEPEAFAETVGRLVADGWRGANVTIPHKEAALALSDRATERARAIGAANTLVFRDGEIHADNTDGFGFIENLNERAPGWSSGAPALVLGAGGSARAILYALMDAGVPEIRLANRTRERAEALARDLEGPIRVIEWERAEAGAEGAGLIVNTTSRGMKGDNPLLFNFVGTHVGAVATDLVYTPLQTRFLEDAASAGLRTVDGLGMLLHQGRPGFEAWFGAAPAVDEELRQLVLSA